ncbi:MAG: bifunctional metallophosphatase/5'-nucleotidase [Chloroflexi bacterium]|nr:bifunctional metallophosphatase/5'-nucleotidase [Chloroflexota bacterium]
MQRTRPLVLVTVIALLASLGATAPPTARAAGPVNFTILHTNDFHGNLELSGSNPGAARVAQKIADVRTAVGDANLLVLDAGDTMQGSLLSNLQKGLPTYDYYRTIGYDAATFGNHEFDWGQTVLGQRIAQAEAAATADEAPMQMIAANITKKDAAGACTWEPFNASVTPYEVFTVGTAPNTVRVGVIGVGSVETPTITIAEATAGLCFRDPAESILHYYGALDAASDVIVVLSHNGYTDGGYGYGISVYGDQTLAKKLNDAGKPANLIIGGHSHTDLSAATMVGNTAVVQAHYAGRKVGRANFTVDTGTGAVSVAWSRITVVPPNPTATPPVVGDPEYPPIKALVDGYVSDPAYQALISQPVGYSAVDLLRNYNGDSMMGDFVDDAIYGALNSDTTATNDVDMFFNNPGGIRTDWCYVGGTWTSSNCAAGLHDPALLTYGQMYSILPFGNATAVGTMTGAQVLELLNQSATLFKGAIQPSGIRYKFYRYSDALPGPQPWAWGAYDAQVYDKAAGTWKALDLKKTYKVGTNEFLAPAGQDGFTPFKYMTGITYWGDMLDSVNAYVSKTYGTPATAYKGPKGDGTLDGRIARDGNDAGGSIVPVTILHHNDSHGNLAKGSFVGYTQLATLIKQEKAHNPTRTILLNGGDTIQGDAMSYYFKSAPLGYAADGTALPVALQKQPSIAAFNAMGYDGMTLGNHEFNFGSAIYKGVLGQATFPVLGANVSDTGAYGLAATQGGAGVKPYVEKTVGGVKVAILGITNHRVPNYELPSNIPGLTFSDPIAKAQELATVLRTKDDAVVALTHIGFTEDPKSVEVDKNVDTNMAAAVTGLDAIIGSHSHTNPATGFGAYKYLPTIVGGPNNTPVIINQAYRYNNTLGEVVLGMRAKAGGGYEVVSRTGQYISVAMSTPEDAAVKAIVDPYVTALAAYNDKVIGKTTVPLDALKAFTEETNAANLQADASVFELNRNGITPDVHLSGAMTNKKVADAATVAAPVTLKISDMFSLMPYENSLVVLKMNGPQIKKVLERAYRNYYYYKYVPGYGGYSYYTTCMLDTNAVGRITYNDTGTYDPAKTYVTSFYINGKAVDFNDATKYYRVSTVNYLAAGSCNFNDNGVSLWPLNQIANDTQFYVRDAVINYITAKGTVSPAIEGRINFKDAVGPVITITKPGAKTYWHSDQVKLTFSATDLPAGVKSMSAKVGGKTYANGRTLDLRTLKLGSQTLTVSAIDWAGNKTTKSVTFKITATAKSMISSVNKYYAERKITTYGLKNRLVTLLNAVKSYQAKALYRSARMTMSVFVALVGKESGKHIVSGAARVLMDDGAYVSAHIRN